MSLSSHGEERYNKVFLQKRNWSSAKWMDGESGLFQHLFQPFIIAQQLCAFSVTAETEPNLSTKYNLNI